MYYCYYIFLIKVKVCGHTGSHTYACLPAGGDRGDSISHPYILEISGFFVLEESVRESA